MKTDSLKILAIGRNPARLAIVQSTVADALPGATLITAQSISHGIIQAQTEDPDVILIDNDPSAGESYATCQQIKTDEAIGHIPVVLLIPLGTDLESRIRALEMGADALLFTPLDAADLNVQVRTAARIKAINGQARREQERLRRQVAERTATLERTVAERESVENALRESCATLDIILNTVPQAIFWKDKEGRYLGCNKLFAAAVGLDDPGQVIGKTDFEFPFVSEDVAKYQADDREVIASGRPKLRIVEPLQLADNSSRWLETSKMRLTDTAGNTIGVLGIFNDITEQEQAKQGLAQERAHLAGVIQGAHVGTWEWNVQTGATVFNERWAEIVGYTLDELAPISIKTWETLAHPDDLAESGELLRQHFVGELPYYDFQCRMRHKNGNWIWVRDRGQVVSWTADGQPLMMFGTHMDITKRRQTEIALQQSHEMLARLTEQVPGVVYQYRLYPDGRSCFPYSSPGMMEIYEYTPEEVREDATPVFGRIHPDDLEYVSAAIFESARTQELFHVEFRVILPRQGLRWRMSDAKPERIEDGSTLWHGIITDITERKQAEDEIRNSENRFHALIKNGRDNISLLAADGTLLWESPSINSTLGYAPDQFVGHNIFELMHPDDYAWIRDLYAQIVQSPGTIQEGEFRLLHADHSWRWIECSATNLLHEPKVQAIVLNYRDITQRKLAEVALTESEDRFRILADDLPALVCEYLPDTTLTYVNAFYTDYFGVPASELIGRSFLDLLPEEAKEGAKVAHLRLTPEEPLEISTSQVILHGDIRWQEWRDRAIFDEQGNAVRYHAIGFDITERKKAENALRESEQAHRLLVQNLYAGVVVHAPDTRIVLANEQAHKLLGLTHDQMLGKDALDPAWHFLREDGTVLPVEEYPVMRVLTTRSPIRATQLGIHHPHTNYTIWVLVNAFPEFSDNGVMRQVVVTFVDITEQTEAQKQREQLLAQVQAQSQQIAQIIDTVPEGVVLLSADGQVVLTNPTGERDLNTLADAAVGGYITHLGALPLAELRDLSVDKMWQEVTAGSRIFEVIARPVAPHSAGTGDLAAEHWVLVINDVTQARNIRDQLEQQERLAAVGQLAAGIAHDFNNILAVISLHAPLLAQATGLNERDKERLDVIREQTAHAAQLIQQILDFSRRAVLQRQPIDLGPFVKEQAKLLTRTLPETMQVALESEPGEYVVLADLTRMRQMVMNLAVNARDAMPDGGTLRLGLSHQSPPPRPDLPEGPWVCLEVADNGTGMTPETQTHLFEPFFTTKGVGRGTGLGLAQVHGIVKQHNGEITVTSVVGQGTTFHIYLPAVAENASTPSPEAQMQGGSGETVLIVEDNPALLDALNDIVDMLGYKAICASNGAEALAVLDDKANRVDLVLSDLSMPVMGGEALLDAMQERGLTIPVIILSGYPLDGTIERLKRKGVIGWLLKPPKVDKLGELLAQVLAGRPLTIDG